MNIYTDKYFTYTKNAIEQNGDAIVTYGLFLRRPCVVALKPAIEFLDQATRGKVDIIALPEGTEVPAQTPIMYYRGSFKELVELETEVLQRVGFACVSAYNAKKMSLSLPNVPFLAMEARHTTGPEMAYLTEYGARVGTDVAKLSGAKGFIGTSNEDCAARVWGNNALGTIPHAAIGYAGSTLQSVINFHNANPEIKNITALVDYYGTEVTDSLHVANWFRCEGLEEKGYSLAVRLDTHGGRFVEGLDYDTSVRKVARWLRMTPANEYDIVQRLLGDAYEIAGDDYIDKTRKILFAQGVSAANIIHMRIQLSDEGFSNVKLVGSSGFDLFKCETFSKANVPVDLIGTGSFLPKTMSETYATADIVKYDDRVSVKVGREWLADQLPGEFK